ncbi:Rec8 like protein-domain-containing protein [Desarmillaria tabescens]|uniref:Rec8 like protein-domain-containing protein n=1 Tax=Armillaria tabescens TaxID=1929756 RepID=A0AA39NG60_ARMTA|nr:Rec8 like protein-domain-containing protein [Desarmillaria tabescens]KAK0465040.1 Rec8 like protein-domain-containing protein [Desarmillaria tabescens]
MFFSPELLARRDSGFGLLWLAATLGSKSTFKKLPKRSVMTADIGQLCDLIAEPSEPLALRLSSNLMVGVARVYKVKQDIFFTDVSHCVASLKKVIQEYQATPGDGQLQMAQPNTRASALTLVIDTNPNYELDAFVADWDAFLNAREDELEEDMPDAEYNPKGKQSKSKSKLSKPQASPPAVAEDVRAELCTLKENYDHLLSASFDLSFSGNAPGFSQDPSSSQVDGGFMNDPFFSDGADLGGLLGDELARELGEGWGGTPTKAIDTGRRNILESDDFAFPADMPMHLDFNFEDNQGLIQPPVSNAATPTIDKGKRKRKANDFQKENKTPLSLPNTPRAITPVLTFSQQLLSQDAEPVQPLQDITQQFQNASAPAQKKIKKTRLLLDARTELTDEELKTARAQYLRGQKLLRHENEYKRSEKGNGRLLEDIIWGVPDYIEAPVLVDFWQENFKVQVEARTGILLIHPTDEPPSKRRKIRDPNTLKEALTGPAEHDYAMDVDMVDFGRDDVPIDFDFGQQIRSSEEPGQGRQVSRPPSLGGGQFDIDPSPEEPLTQSQRSSLFPWDNAGVFSSSSGAGGFAGGSDRISVDRADIRMRGSSVSRRESSLVPSASATGLGLSPGVTDRGSQVGEDYQFEVDPEEGANNLNSQMESQKSDLNLVTLERNSFNFLEYTKMQFQTLPDFSNDLSFDAIAPPATSTRHVAAAAFYHCLVLATKDLLHLRQPQPYGPISLLLVPN